MNDVFTAVALGIGIISLIFSIVAGVHLLAGLRQVSEINEGVVDHLALLDADQVANCLIGEGGVAHVARWCLFAHGKGFITTVSASTRKYEPTADGKELIQEVDPTIVPTLLARAEGRPDDSVPQHLAALDLGSLNRALLAYKAANGTAASLKDVVAILAAYLGFPAPS